MVESIRSWNKIELDRIRKANELKEICRKSLVIKSGPKYVLAYYPDGNLVLLRKLFLGWDIVDQTGPWFKMCDVYMS